MDSIRSPLQYAAFLIYAYRFDDFPKNFQPPWLLNPNYVAPTLAPAVNGVAIATIIFALLIVALRLWPRRAKPVSSWGPDDYLILLSLGATIGYVVVQILSTTQGCVGRHIYDCTIAENLYAYKMQYIGLLMYFSCATFIKTSILFFLRRLNTSRAMAWIIDGTIVFSVITFVGSLFMILFQCRPISAAWNAEERLGHAQCLSPWKLVFSWAVVYTATDIWLIIFPLTMFWRMHKGPQRYGVLFITLWGVVATVATVVKTILLPKAYNTFDGSWKFVGVVILSQVELAIGIVAASLPGLVYLFQRCAPGLSEELHTPVSESSPQEYKGFDSPSFTKMHEEKHR